MGLRRLAVLGLLVAGGALAGRNSSGTYSLPAGNPVVTLTTISSTWANNTLSDLGVEVTNSLDRNGRGCMLAPLQLNAGTIGTPGLNWCTETNSGLYRIGIHDFGFSVNGSLVEEFSSTTGTSSKLGLTVTTANSQTAVTGTGAAGSGATPGGNGGNFQGAAGGGAGGGGYGVVGIGGAGGGGAPGDGVHGQGAIAGGVGVSGVGGGSGAGGYFTGGNNGGQFGIGVLGVGAVGTGRVGGQFNCGTAATGGTPQSAIYLSNGYMDMTAVPAPSPTTAIGAGLVTPSSAARSWGQLHTDGVGGCVVDQGFNVASCSTSATAITVNFPASAGNMGTSNYAVSLTSFFNTNSTQYFTHSVTANAAGSFTFSTYKTTTAAAVTFINPSTTALQGVDFAVFSF